MTGSLDVLSEASRLRHGIPCSFADDNPYVGGSHRVFKVVFEDSVRWAARINQDPNNWETELRAVRRFQHVKKQCVEIKAPNLYVAAEHPVLYSEWVSGNPLAIWNSKIPLLKRHSLLDDLAEFLLQLWTTAVPSALAPEQNCLYSVWLTQSLDRGLRRTLTGTAKWGNATDYLIMRSMVPKYAAEFDKYIGVGFTHGDLNAHNVMINDDFNLTGVIDWDWMSVAPLPAIINHPWFIADIPGWNNDGVANGESFKEDRTYLENAIKKKELSRHLPLTKASASFGQRRAIGKALLDLLRPLSFVGLASLIIHEISVGRASTGDFVFFIQYWSSLISPLAYLSAQYRWLVSYLVDAERLLYLFNSKPSITENDNATILNSGDGRVVFENVNFAYDTRLPILKDAPSPTLRCDLWPDQIDGQDIRDITLSSLQEAIGVVPQDPVLFNASILENLLYARPSATDEEIQEACRAAAIHERIVTFVDGYNTTVGENGVKLSGGELQRIAIARVFLKKSPVLLLDEATSAVDSETESEIQAALDRLRARRTTFVIAHRLSTVVGADMILVLHEGESGKWFTQGAGE
ncbi:uncharacterized protein N7446_003928 [Penicillium canescens]|uniref:uncharacterized protein n=1 Tax=Penicillium canescens TaxID=5083 RepID=UPI0026E0CC8C|nr:uncharacterized protein N7446_003928 [Penicillium canescens]KAJ6066891.1 hypothetical protein N7446_003928 [Penicillium canescens]